MDIEGGQKERKKSYKYNFDLYHLHHQRSTSQSSAFSPSIHSSLVTHPTIRHTGHDTPTSPPSTSSLLPNATLSALTKQAGWNVWAHASPPDLRGRIDSCFMLASDEFGSSSDGPTPQLTSQHLRPTSRSFCSTRCRSVSPGGGGSVQGLFSRGGPRRM
jgi:hypothetical protein